MSKEEGGCGRLGGLGVGGKGRRERSMKRRWGGGLVERGRERGTKEHPIRVRLTSRVIIRGKIIFVVMYFPLKMMKFIVSAFLTRLILLGLGLVLWLGLESCEGMIVNLNRNEF